MTVREGDHSSVNLAGPTALNPVEVMQGRQATVGGVGVVRVLPNKGRRTVGPWCFVDCILPDEFAEPHPLEVGPHPHTGLATVTWLFEGEALHGDSLGTEQLIRPGQLNLMTAGRGIAHAELGVTAAGRGFQMWLAQPEATRHGPSRFEHHAELPTMSIGNGEATVLLGTLGETTSPAVVDTELVGTELRLGPGLVELPTNPRFEYAIVPIDAPVRVGDAIVRPGWLGMAPVGAELLAIEAGRGGARVMVLGGIPLGERVQMWWNFVARTRDELTEAWQDWQNRNTDRFGEVNSSLARIDAPPPPWI
ncbi:MAG: pirin family protein [Acidimicrobiia bacterium]|nr:pirin family protein [Acidimicrobiia bacterium]